MDVVFLWQSNFCKRQNYEIKNHLYNYLSPMWYFCEVKFLLPSGSATWKSVLSILKYYKPINFTLPDPSGQLSASIPSMVILAANREVGSAQQECLKKHGTYQKYSSKEWADIARYAIMYGIMTAKSRFLTFWPSGLFYMALILGCS